MTAARTLRCRQLVVVAHDRDSTVDALRDSLGLGEGFVDPGVGAFGLVNRVLAVGDCFLEVVSPASPDNGSAGSRHLARAGGDAGYMVIFQVDGYEAIRQHLADLGIREVWAGGLTCRGTGDRIDGVHAHPSDIGGAIVSFDAVAPRDGWPWAGPTWRSDLGEHRFQGFASATISGPDPEQLAQRWAAVLAVAPTTPTSLELDDGFVLRFVAPETVGGRLGLVAIDLASASPASRFETPLRIAGVDFTSSLPA